MRLGYAMLPPSKAPILELLKTLKWPDATG